MKEKREKKVIKERLDLMVKMVYLESKESKVIAVILAAVV